MNHPKLQFFFMFVTVTILTGFAFVNITSAYTHVTTLRFGSTGSQVVALQDKLGVSPLSGYFGNITRSAVINFQSANNLFPDGIVGPITGTALSGTVARNSPYPEDCNLGFGYSPSTGLPCSGLANLPSGCTSIAGYSVTTGKSCNTIMEEPQFLIEGCFSSSGYSTVSGKPCTTDVASDDFLSGEVGELASVKRIFPVATNIGIPENASNVAFAGYSLKNDKGSDLTISSVKISLKLTSGNASNNLNKYVKTISISQDGTIVGSADVTSFSKNSNVYTKVISLSNAKIYNDQESVFYLKVNTLENISSSNEDNVWTVTLVGVRYRDETGSLLVDSSTGAIGTDGDTNFHFIPVVDDDQFPQEN